jgi:hypothetical protein
MELEVKINFDEASRLWRQNKKYIGNGKFVYICNYVNSCGKQCRRTIYSQIQKNPYGNLYENLEFGSLKYINHPNKDIYCKRHLNRKINHMR